MSKLQNEMATLQRAPKISLISSEVAKSLTKQRPPQVSQDFIEYSQEWKKLRDAKIMHKRQELEHQLMEEHKPKHPRVSDEQLPDGYKGPLSGYYDRVSTFFAKKQLKMEQSMARPVGIPQINRSRSRSRKQDRQ